MMPFARPYRSRWTDGLASYGAVLPISCWIDSIYMFTAWKSSSSSSNLTVSTVLRLFFLSAVFFLSCLAVFSYPLLLPNMAGPRDLLAHPLLGQALDVTRSLLSRGQSINWILVTSVLASVLIAYFIINFVYYVFFHPYAKYPGPYLAKFTDLYAGYHAWKGDLHLDMWRCHMKYGDKVRYAPNRLNVNTVTGLRSTKNQTYHSAKC